MTKYELKMMLVGLVLAVIAVNAIFASAIFWLRFLR